MDQLVLDYAAPLSILLLVACLFAVEFTVTRKRIRIYWFSFPYLLAVPMIALMRQTGMDARSDVVIIVLLGIVHLSRWVANRKE